MTIDTQKLRESVSGRVITGRGKKFREMILSIADHVDAQAAEIAALRQPWQPIETAPVGKNPDGAIWLMLAWGPEGDQSVGNGMRWRDKWFAAPTFYCLGQERKYAFKEVEIQPTHWMPLPAEPAALSGESNAQQ